jgi:HK97 family phage portal protein
MLATLARPKVEASVTWSPLDDRWYREIGGMRSDAGPVIVPEAALGVSVVYRAVNVLAHSVASVPLVVYRRTDDDGKERARDHSAYDLLHDRPNPWMTSFRWRHLVMSQAILWGNHHSEIMPGPGGIGGLVPLNPDTTRVVDQLGDGRLVYVTRDLSERGYEPERRLLQDNVFHVRGFSLDGKSGIPLTKLARNAIGLALSAERHGSMFLRNGARFSGYLSTPSPMQKEVREDNEKAWQRAYGGPNSSGKTPLLVGGLKYEPISANNKDSQWLEARQFQVEELLRYLGVPGVLVGHPDKTATYASAEQFFLSFVTHSVRPWTENIAAELGMSVVLGAPEFFADFILEGLLRGDIKTRYDAHRISIASGWKTRNEARVEENYNRGPDELDEFLEPLNMVEAGSERETSAAQPPRSPEPEDGARAQLVRIAGRGVERLVRKEFAAICGAPGRTKGAAARYADDADGWEKWLAKFYDEHAVQIAEDLSVPLADARTYCEAQCERFGALATLTDSAEAESVRALASITPGLENGHA